MQAARLATVVPLHRRAATYPDIESVALASLIERKTLMATALDRLCAAVGDLRVPIKTGHWRKFQQMSAQPRSRNA